MSYTRQQMKKFIKNNPDRILDNSIMCAIIAEMISAEEDGHLYVNESGFDQYNPKTKERIEVKYTNSVQRDTLFRIKSVLSKQYRSDFIKIIDGVNNRKFLVPTKTFFKRASLYKDGSFWWSASYNKYDNIQCCNTDLLLDYEV